jgi:hypothetical protein
MNAYSRSSKHGEDRRDVRDKYTGLNYAIDEHRYRTHDNSTPRKLKLGQKISGHELRKREIRNVKRRSRKRIYELTPQIPSMASIPEDEMDQIEESAEYEKTILQNFLQKSRRRDSLSSVTSRTSEDLSDEETTDESQISDTRSQRPDYMNLGDFGEEAPVSRYHFYR